jgi:hypothetical protein
MISFAVRGNIESARFPGFTRKYGIKMLVWFEQHENKVGAYIGIGVFLDDERGRNARISIATRATAEKVEQGMEDRDDRAI